MSTPGSQAASPRRPLDGIVVADFSRVLAGPYATMLLADMGATVIKVESPNGDDTRLWMPPERDGIGTYYLSVNRNKSSIALDLADGQDLRTAYAILDRADVFVENFKPGGLARFGLDPESVRERWPRLIHASITGFGTAGGASMPGYDLLVQGMSGFMHVTGHPDADPQRAGVAIFDVVTGLHTAVGILAALLERQGSGDGLGQHVALNLLSSALSGLVNQTTGYAAAGDNPQRLGNDHPSLYPYGPFPAADQDLIICVGNDHQFARLVQTLGVPELADDPRFESVLLRNENRDELRILMAEALAAEQEAGLLDVAGYVSLRPRVEHIRHELLRYLLDCKAAGKRVVGYGAPGKGNTLLNYCGIRSDLIEYTVDRNPYKHGRYTPGTRIPIHSTDRLEKDRPDVIVILPWNLATEITEQLAYIAEWGAELAIPLPSLEIVRPGTSTTTRGTR